MSLTPLHDRVIIRPADEETETPGGVILPDVAQEKSHHGEVIAVGPGRTENGILVPMQVKVGDSVLYGKYTGTEIKANGEDVIIARENDIFAIL